MGDKRLNLEVGWEGRCGEEALGAGAFLRTGHVEQRTAETQQRRLADRRSTPVSVAWNGSAKRRTFSINELIDLIDSSFRILLFISYLDFFFSVLQKYRFFY